MGNVHRLLLQARAELLALDPEPNSEPGPVASGKQRAFEVLQLVESALGWIESKRETV